MWYCGVRSSGDYDDGALRGLFSGHVVSGSGALRHWIRFAAVQCDKVLNATSPRWQAMLLRVPPEIARRMTEIKEGCAEKWVAEMQQKLELHMHIPYRVTGILGAYVRFPLLECKQCIQDPDLYNLKGWECIVLACSSTNSGRPIMAHPQKFVVRCAAIVCCMCSEGLVDM